MERFLWKCQKQSFADVLQNMSSEKMRKFCTKIPVSQSLCNQVAGLAKACNSNIKRLQHRTFPVIFAKLLRTLLFTELPMAASTADLQTKDLLHKSYKKTSATASLL